MSRIITNLKLSMAIPDHLEADEVKMFFETAFDEWVNDELDSAVLGVEVLASSAGRSWRDTLKGNLEALDAGDSAWDREREQYEEGIMSLPVIAKLCGVSRTAVYNWIKDGKLPAMKNGQQEEGEASHSDTTVAWIILRQDFRRFAGLAIERDPEPYDRNVTPNWAKYGRTQHPDTSMLVDLPKKQEDGKEHVHDVREG